MGKGWWGCGLCRVVLLSFRQCTVWEDWLWSWVLLVINLSLLSCVFYIGYFELQICLLLPSMSKIFYRTLLMRSFSLKTTTWISMLLYGIWWKIYRTIIGTNMQQTGITPQIMKIVVESCAKNHSEYPSIVAVGVFFRKSPNLVRPTKNWSPKSETFSFVCGSNSCKYTYTACTREQPN